MRKRAYQKNTGTVRKQNRGQSRKIRQRLALLLVAAFIVSQTATAFAVEKTNLSEDEAVSDRAVLSEDTISSDKAGTAEGAALTDKTGSEDGTFLADKAVLSEDAVSQDNAVLSEDAVSQDKAVLSENTVSQDLTEGSGTVSPNASETETPAGISNVMSSEEFLVRQCEELNTILSERTLKAAVFDCDEYELKRDPLKSSETVMRIPCASTLELKSVSFNEGEFWFEVRTCLGETEGAGYVRKKNIVCVDEDYIKWEEGFRSEVKNNLENNRISGSNEKTDSDIMSTIMSSFKTPEDLASGSIDSFPENYRDKLYALNASHPNWVFVPQNLNGLSLESAVNGEYANKDRNWVYYTAPEQYKEGLTKDSSGKWYYASKSCIDHYMNPLNFLDDTHVFQFEQLAYNSACHTQEGVQSILNGTFMAGKIEDDTLTYAEAFMRIGKDQGLSPYHLSSRVRLEQGVNGTSPLISGTYPGFEGYYNYFNIKASDPDKVVKGLTYAKEQGWNTRFKSLNGGASFIGNGYISAGQDTLYLEKFDLVGTLYTHQYMQNVQAPSSEAVTTYNQYKNSGTVNNPFVFKIPVFNDASSGGGGGKDQVNNVNPQASFKLIKKANLFYTEASPESYAQYRINANVDIYGVKTSDSTSGKAGGNPYFEVIGLSGNVLTLRTRNRTAGNSQSTYKKVFITVSSDAGDFEASFNVSVMNSKPAIKTQPAVIYEGFEGGSVCLTDNKGNDIRLPQDVTVSTDDSTIKCSVSADRGFISVLPEASFKAGNRSFRLESAQWIKPITVKARVKKGTVPTLKLSKKSVTLNTKIPMEQYGTLNVRTGVNGSGIRLSDLKVTAGNAGTEEALNSGLSVVYDKETDLMKLGVRDGKAKKGSYSLVLDGTVKNPAGEELALKSVKMTVKVIEKEKEKAFTLRSTGRINLVDRADSCITCTPAFSGTGAERIIRIASDGGSKFEAMLLKKGDITPDGKAVATDSGIIVIRAKEGAALNRSEAYALTIDSTLDNGLEVRKVLNVRPSQTPAKIYGNIITAAMTRSSSTSRNYVIRSKGLTKYDSVIERVEPDPGTLGQAFSYKPDEGQGKKRYYSGLFELKDKNIKNGTYSIRFNVFLKDSGQNVSPLRVVLKVRVR